jgi:hypothetical protein
MAALLSGDEGFVDREIAIDGGLVGEMGQHQGRLGAGEERQIFGATRVPGHARSGGAPEPLGAELGLQRQTRRELLGQDSAAPLADYRHVGGHLGAQRAEPLAVQDQPRARAMGEGRGVVGGISVPLARAGQPRVLREEHAVTAEADEVAEEAHIDRLPAVADRHRVLVAVGAHQTLPVHRRHAVEPVARRRRRQGSEGGPLVGQQVARALPVRLRDLAGLLLLPEQALPGEILLVGEAPPGQEVRLHPLHEILDAALLLRRAGVAEFRVKPDLGGEAPEGGIPARLALGVAAEGHRFHVVEDPRPRHAAPALDDLEH